MLSGIFLCFFEADASKGRVQTVRGVLLFSIRFWARYNKIFTHTKSKCLAGGDIDVIIHITMIKVFA